MRVAALVLLCAIRAQDLDVSCARGHTLAVDEQVCKAAGPSSALHDCVCHSCSNGTANSAAGVYRLDGFVALSMHGLGACFCGATSCAVSCGANNRPVCLAWSREPSASACADRCRLLPSCVALEFVEHPIEGTWCHLLQARPTSAQATPSGGCAYEGKYCFVRAPLGSDGWAPTTEPAYSGCRSPNSLPDSLPTSSSVPSAGPTSIAADPKFPATAVPSAVPSAVPTAVPTAGPTREDFNSSSGRSELPLDRGSGPPGSSPGTQSTDRSASAASGTVVVEASSFDLKLLALTLLLAVLIPSLLALGWCWHKHYRKAAAHSTQTDDRLNPTSVELGRIYSAPLPPLVSVVAAEVVPVMAEAVPMALALPLATVSETRCQSPRRFEDQPTRDAAPSEPAPKPDSSPNQHCQV